SEHGWPASEAAAPAARVSLDATNACEWWLLATRSDGEPDLGGSSFPIADSFAYGDARFAHAFDRGVALDESMLLEEQLASVARGNAALPSTAAGAPSSA